MANEIDFMHFATGSNLYAVIFDTIGRCWDAGGEEFLAMEVANWGDYAITLSESPASGYRYRATFPAAIDAAKYTIRIFERAGASPDVTDQMHGSGDMHWNGSAEVDLADITTAVSSLNDISTAEVNAEVDTALADYDGPTHSEVTTATQAAKLASDGLDSIATTAPTGVASDFREMLVQVWRRFFKKSTVTGTEFKTYADNGTDVLTTQTVSDDGSTQTMGESS